MNLEMPKISTTRFRPRSQKLWQRPGVKVAFFIFSVYILYSIFTGLFQGVSSSFGLSAFSIGEQSPNIHVIDLAASVGTSNGSENGERILICVPLRDAAQHISMFFAHLRKLTYPHELIDLAFLVSDSTDDTLAQLHAHLEEVQSSDDPKIHFNDIVVIEKDFGQAVDQSFSDRHGFAAQGSRRKLMARARNWLLSATLRPYHSWVYWRDADVEIAPATILEDLMKHNQDVIVPNVWRPLPEWLGKEQPYDLNSWQESDAALQLASTLDEDAVIVEGYAEYATWRPHLAYLRDPYGNKDDLIPLDGIGGVSILAKASVFRAGAMFPAFSFERHAETEGFGKLCRRMGFSVTGLPHYVIWHIYEPSLDDLKYMAEQEKDRIESEHQQKLRASRKIEGQRAQMQWKEDLEAIREMEEDGDADNEAQELLLRVSQREKDQQQHLSQEQIQSQQQQRLNDISPQQKQQKQQKLLQEQEEQQQQELLQEQIHRQFQEELQQQKQQQQEDKPQSQPQIQQENKPQSQPQTQQEEQEQKHPQEQEQRYSQEQEQRRPQEQEQELPQEQEQELPQEQEQEPQEQESEQAKKVIRKRSYQQNLQEIQQDYLRNLQGLQQQQEQEQFEQHLEEQREQFLREQQKQQQQNEQQLNDYFKQQEEGITV